MQAPRPKNFKNFKVSGLNMLLFRASRKPGSVTTMAISLRKDSRPFLSDQPGGRRATSSLPIWSCSKRGLPGSSVTRWPVGSYPTFSPLLLKGAVCFCGTLPRLAPAGCYPALRPMEPGLSSFLYGTRPSGILGYLVL